MNNDNWNVFPAEHPFSVLMINALPLQCMRPEEWVTPSICLPLSSATEEAKGNQILEDRSHIILESLSLSQSDPEHIGSIDALACEMGEGVEKGGGGVPEPLFPSHFLSLVLMVSLSL